jgi:hypothetical protein
LVIVVVTISFRIIVVAVGVFISSMATIRRDALASGV